MPLQGHALVPVMAVRVETKGASLARKETELCRSRWLGGQECGRRCLEGPIFRVSCRPKQWLLGVRGAGVWRQAEMKALTCRQVLAAVGTWRQVSQVLVAWDLARLAVQEWRLPLACIFIFKANTSSKPRPQTLWLPALEKTRHKDRKQQAQSPRVRNKSLLPDYLPL